MNRLETSLTILKQSLRLLEKHRKLLLFPLLSALGYIAMFLFFVMPLLFDTTVPELLRDYPRVFEDLDFGGREEMDSPGYLPWLLVYFAGMLLTSFLNVALYHEIIQAFNGSEVSFRRGLGVACSKFRAIFFWSLLAGTVGMLIRHIEQHIGLIGKWITAMIGVAWSVASVFAIPIIIREREQQDNPVHYLQASAALIRRSWGEGLAGIVGLTLFTWLIIIATAIFSISALILSHSMLVPIAASLFIAILLYLQGMARNIFLCGLYIYASEGVAPGSFSEETFDRVWKVSKR